MLKARNIIIIFVVNYLALVAISAFLELYIINSRAQEVVETIRAAGDMALDQTQAIDEYLTSASSGGYKITMPEKSGAGFKQVDLYGGIWSLDATNSGSKKQIFDRLYNNTEFKLLATRASVMTMPVKYWDSTETRFVWYYMPRVMAMGKELYSQADFEHYMKVRTSNGSVVNSDLRDGLYKTYNLLVSERQTDGKDYYNTPLSFGMTYVNKDLVQKLFVNNMDLIMRTKYKENLNKPEGGAGVLKGETYADRIKDDIAQYNPINNGTFTYLKGQCTDSSVGTQVCEGVEPQISYKVIDMFDAKNDDLLIQLFGANKGSYKTKAEYLKSLESNRIDPATNKAYTSKPIVVAKVTFYVDIIVPYFSIIFRDFRTDLDNNSLNFADIQQTSPSGDGGSRRIAYTRYFAVTP